jgi:hypothetical protein
MCLSVFALPTEQRVRSKKKALAIVLALGAYCWYRTNGIPLKFGILSCRAERLEITCPTL